MGAHFWGQVGATIVILLLVLGSLGRMVEVEALACDLADRLPSRSFFTKCVAVVVAGIFLAVVIWS